MVNFTRIFHNHIFSGGGFVNQGPDAAVVVAMLTLGTLAASAQKALPSCSYELRRCASLARHARTCLLAKEARMKTGRWIGPETGKDFGPHLKQ